MLSPPADVAEGDNDQDRDEPAGDPPGKLQGAEDQDDPGRPFRGRQAYTALIDGVFHGNQVQRGACGQQPEQDIEKAPDQGRVFAQRVNQRRDQGKTGEMQRILPKGRQHRNHVEPDMQQRDGNSEDDQQAGWFRTDFGFEFGCLHARKLRDCQRPPRLGWPRRSDDHLTSRRAGISIPTS